MEWKSVYVFVSSTFNDMHAERDLLVKRVFPELRLWCAKRKLQLREIDLRWGVSAEDAQENKRVVEVCLKNIDRCRPFFLCFMGQRRGWIPLGDSINETTLEAFPELSGYIGKASVTELEVIHALLHPMASGAKPARCTRFYFRDPSYTKSLSDAAHKDLFIPGRSLFRTSDKGVEEFRKQLSRQHATFRYTARWNPELPSPELTGELSKGRLEHFRVGERSLEEDVLQWLKASIDSEFPDHRELPELASELERELDRQDTQRFQSVDGYIPRPVEELALAESMKTAGSRPLVLLARAGCGKTSLLAAFLQKPQKLPVYYRFVGTTPLSFRLEDLSATLVAQWVRDGLLPDTVLEYTAAEQKLIFSSLCVQAAEAKPFLLVLDGMDQLLNGENWVSWLPKQMPEGAQLMISLKDTGAEIPDTLAVHRLGLMTDAADKAQMASAYMSAFLKDIDKTQMSQLLSMEGSANPLYMKIVLNELRQHGSFDTLMELFRTDYGSVPQTAFAQVLQRMERSLENTCFDAGGAMLLFFGCLAYARQGLDSRVFLQASRCLHGWSEERISDRQVLDLIYGLSREMEPYLVMDGGQIALRYDSLRQAIRRDNTVLYAQYANILLAQGFLVKVWETRDKEDARIALIHVAEGTEDYIRSFFSSAIRTVTLLQCGGANMLAKCCDELVRRRNMQDFADLAKVLYRSAARLDTNPNTLFLELRRYGDLKNSVTAALLESGKNFETGVLLYPRYQPKDAGALCWEYAHPASASGCEIWAAPYFVSIHNYVLRVTDLRTRELLSVMHLHRRYREGKILLAAEKDILYLCLLDKDNVQARICAYKLPDMAPIGDQTSAECPYGTVWNLVASGGKLYAMQFRSTGPDKTVGRYTVCCLNTGKILFSEEAANFHYQLCGSWFVYRNDATGVCRVISLEDGRCLFEEQYLGTDHLDPATSGRLTPYAKLFANKANLYAACAEKLYIWKSGSRITPDGKIELLQRMHRLAPADDGTLTLEKTWSERVGSHSAFAVLDDRYLITESQGYLELLDSDCRNLGKLNLGENIQHATQASTLFAMFEGQILMFHKDKIRSYDAAKLVAALDPNLKESFVGRRDRTIIDDRLYVMDLEMERIDLESLELTREKPTGKQLWEKYDPWNMQGQDLWIGYGIKSGYFTVKRPDTMDRIVRCRIPDWERRELQQAFLYRDSHNVLQVGLLETDKEKTCRPSGREKREFARLWLRTKPLLKLDGETPWTEKSLNAEVAVSVLGLSPSAILVEGKPYIMIPNVYQDANTIQLRVYDLLKETVIYKEEVDLRSSFSFSPFNFKMCLGGAMYCTGNGEQAKLEVIDLRVPKGYEVKRDITMLSSDPLAKQVCLFDKKSRELLLYDMDTHGLSRITTLDKEIRPSQAVLLEQHVILTEQFRDTVRIFDRKSGDLLCCQRLEIEPDELLAHIPTGTVAMVDSNSRKYFWTLKESTDT